MDEHEVTTRFDRLDAQQPIAEEAARTRAHIDQAVEALSARIRAVDDRCEALLIQGAELKQARARLEAAQCALEQRLASIESHLAAVEKVDKIALTEVRGLATKLDRFTRLRRAPILDR